MDMDYLADLLKRCDLDYLLQSGYKSRLCATLVQMLYIEKEETCIKVPFMNMEPVGEKDRPMEGNKKKVVHAVDGNRGFDNCDDEEFVELVSVTRHLRISPGIKMNEVLTAFALIFMFVHICVLACDSSPLCWT